MDFVYLEVSYTCSGCGEDAESDGDVGLICRRCSVSFDGYNNGSEGRSYTPSQFVEWFGDAPPEPTKRERLHAAFPKLFP